MQPDLRAQLVYREKSVLRELPARTVPTVPTESMVQLAQRGLREMSAQLVHRVLLVQLVQQELTEQMVLTGQRVQLVHRVLLVQLVLKELRVLLVQLVLPVQTAQWLVPRVL